MPSLPMPTSPAQIFAERRSGAESASGFTSAFLYSTASYQTGDLSGIGFGFGSNLSGWSFAGKNLTDADFVNATITA